MSRNLNGTGDKISYPSLAMSSVANTISIWFYPTGAQNSSYYVIHDRNNGGTHGGGIFASGSSPNKMAYYYGSGSGHTDPGTNSYSNNTWNHVALVLSGSGLAVSAYLNGSLDGTNTSWDAQTQTNILGANGTNSNFAGMLADFAFWSGVGLTSAEIVALSLGVRPHTIRPSFLQIYSPIDGLQSPEPDFSGNANNGTLTGTALGSGPPVMQFTPRWPAINAFDVQQIINVVDTTGVLTLPINCVVLENQIYPKDAAALNKRGMGAIFRE